MAHHGTAGHIAHGERMARIGPDQRKLQQNRRIEQDARNAQSQQEALAPIDPNQVDDRHRTGLIADEENLHHRLVRVLPLMMPRMHRGDRVADVTTRDIVSSPGR
jgi:hypothetical protein